MRWVSLHHHNTMSFMDGHGLVSEHFALMAEYGYQAGGVTDHGNTSAHPQAEKAAAKTGVKAIFGLEAYTAPDLQSRRKYHMTILAMDAEGYRSLMRIVSESWKNFYQYPTVTGDILARNSEGIIVLSGCSDSLLSCSLLGGKDIAEEDASYERAYQLAGRMKDLLGDRYYLETQVFPEFERSQKLNMAFEKMGKALGISLCSTADVHTLREGDHEIRALLHAAGRGNANIAQQLSSWEYEVPDYIPPSDEWVWERLNRAGLGERAAQEAFHATEEIASRCNVTLPKAERLVFPGTVKDLKW
jgi:DNA polymerase-3 subunit alpha